MDLENISKVLTLIFGVVSVGGVGLALTLIVRWKDAHISTLEGRIRLLQDRFEALKFFTLEQVQATLGTVEQTHTGIITELEKYVARLSEGSPSIEESVEKAALKKTTIQAMRDIGEIFSREKSQQMPLEIFAEGTWPDWQDDINQRTILLVTGCHQLPETFDRPSAYYLKAKIDSLGRSLKVSFLRSLVIGDIWFFDHSGYSDHPHVVSLGSPSSNALTGVIANEATTVRLGEDDRWRIMKSGNRWALFGDRAENTRSAVNAFIETELATYVKHVWRN